MNLSKYLLRRSIAALGLGLLALQSAQSYAAKCEYVVQSDWNNGFVASIRITNNTSSALNGWSVNWNYTDGSSRTSGWNANVSGSNPYTATGVGWNNTIQPGQTVEFGVQGTKGVGSASASKPIVGGSVCDSITSSSAASIATNSSTTSVGSSSLPSSSSSSGAFSSGISFYSSVTSSSRSSTSSGRSSSSLTSSSVSSVSSVSSSRSISSQSNSSSSLALPTPKISVEVHGLTVFVDARASSDPLNRPLRHTIYFGDSETLPHSHGWHTYSKPGEYEITLLVSPLSGSTSSYIKQKVQVSVSADANRAPINMLTAARNGSYIKAWGTASFDEDGDALQYIWDFGQGEFVGESQESHYGCSAGSSASASSASTYSTVVLTISDGTLADTKIVARNANCNLNEDLKPTPKITARVDGLTVHVDARKSDAVTAVVWDFGDGTTSNDLIATHTYAAVGEYQLKLTGLGEFFNNSVIQPIVIDGTTSSSSVQQSSISSNQISSSSVSNSQASSQSSRSTSSSISSAISSSISSAGSQYSSSPFNHYNAPKAAVAPVIDGVAEAVWNNVPSSPINVFWLGTQPNPSGSDFWGSYKAVWTEEYLYMLVNIEDDKLFDGVADPLDRYWEDDTVELFIDENHNGGQHGYNTSAWAYHVSTLGDVVDYTTSGPKLLNDHIQVARSMPTANGHIWELRIKIYGEDYADWKTNTPLTLSAGKLMGFSVAYIDNDGSPQRESMMGSVDTQGHKNNQGYLDASVFGTLLLVE